MNKTELPSITKSSDLSSDMDGGFLAAMQYIDESEPFCKQLVVSDYVLDEKPPETVITPNSKLME